MADNAAAAFVTTSTASDAAHQESHAESNKFSCCAPSCIACWICVLFWPILFFVLLTLAASTAIPPLAQSTMDGSRIHLVEASAIQTDKPQVHGVQQYNLTSVMRLVNPVPIGTQLPGGNVTMSVNEAFSSFTPAVVATSKLPERFAAPGSQTFTYSAFQYMNLSKPTTTLFALGMTWPFVFEDCPGCVPTVTTMRPIPLTLASKFRVKVLSLIDVDVSLDKTLICHCIENYPGNGGQCQALTYRTPYGNLYTPCEKNRPPCHNKTQHDYIKDRLVGGIALMGFHCMPIDDVLF